MSYIAIDVVLLPSTEMSNKIIDLNKSILQKKDNKIILGSNRCFPHISLCMGVIEKKDLPLINQRLRDIADNYTYFELEGINIKEKKFNNKRILSCLTIKKNKEIQDFHETILKTMDPFISHESSGDMLVDSKNIDDVTLKWIDNYYEDRAYDKFYPHITIGFGKIKEIKLPIKFICPRLAICHLGNYCVCDKIIFDMYLKKLI